MVSLTPCRFGPAAAVATLLALSVSGQPARAGLLTIAAAPYTGDPARTTVTFDDVTTPGTVRVTVTVDPSPSVGDINGFFLNVGNEVLLPGLSVAGRDVTLLVKGADAVTRAGPGNTINGQGVGPFDVGIRIGTPGIGRDDIRSTTFVLGHEGVALTNDLFAGARTEDGDIFAVRLTSVGLPGSARDGSSKLRPTGRSRAVTAQSTSPALFPSRRRWWVWGCSAGWSYSPAGSGLHTLVDHLFPGGGLARLTLGGVGCRSVRLRVGTPRVDSGNGGRVARRPGHTLRRLLTNVTLGRPRDRSCSRAHSSAVLPQNGPASAE